MKRIIPIVLSVALLAVSSCKKFEETVNKVATKGSLSCTANGRTYTAGTVGVTVTDNTFMLRGSQMSDEESLDIDLLKYKGPGKYELSYMYNGATYRDSKTHNAVYGEIEVISTGDKSAKGTFYFQTDDSVMVKDGKFDVKWE